MQCHGPWCHQAFVQVDVPSFHRKTLVKVFGVHRPNWVFWKHRKEERGVSRIIYAHTVRALLYPLRAPGQVI